MAKTKRYNVTLDEETVLLLSLWRKKGVPGSEAIREAVKAYSRWKKAELQPKPGDYDGVDTLEGEAVVQYD